MTPARGALSADQLLSLRLLQTQSPSFKEKGTRLQTLKFWLGLRRQKQLDSHPASPWSTTTRAPLVSRRPGRSGGNRHRRPVGGPGGCLHCGSLSALEPSPSRSSPAGRRGAGLTPQQPPGPLLRRRTHRAAPGRGQQHPCPAPVEERWAHRTKQLPPRMGRRRGPGTGLGATLLAGPSSAQQPARAWAALSSSKP